MRSSVIGSSLVLTAAMLAGTAAAEPTAIRLTEWIAGQANQTLEVELTQRFNVNNPSQFTLPDFPFEIQGRGDHIVLIATEHDVVMAIKEDVNWPKAISLTFEPDPENKLRLQSPSFEEYEQASQQGSSLAGKGVLTWRVDVQKERFTSIAELDEFIEDDALDNISSSHLRWNRYDLNQLYRKWVQSP